MRSLLLVIAVLAAAPAVALPPRPNLLEARTLAMGGALRTLAQPVAAARLNPAAIGMERGFFVGATYATREQDSFDALSLTVVDNLTSPIGGAIQFLHTQGNTDEREDLGIGFSVGEDGYWWGFTVRYVQGREAERARWQKVVTGDTGFLIDLPSGMRFAIVAYDVVQQSLDFLDRRLALGVSRSDLWGWNLAADAVRNFDVDMHDGFDAHLGAEYLFPRSPWRVRFGQMWRGDTGKDYASVGVGWERGIVRVGYAVQKARQRSDEYLHVLSAEGQF